MEYEPFKRKPALQVAPCVHGASAVVQRRIEYGGTTMESLHYARRPAGLPNRPGEAALALPEGAAAPRGAGLAMPGRLRQGIESLSGMSMKHVKVHYNASQPTQYRAHAYAQGSHIYLAPGQEMHLPHEAWHVVQQAQGRVAPTARTHGVAVNTDQSLEHEADRMGARAAQDAHGGPGARQAARPLQFSHVGEGTVQRREKTINATAKTQSGQTSSVTFTSGKFEFAPKTRPNVYAEVGLKMEANLYQESPIVGTPVGIGWLWMDELKARVRGTRVIRGHLLNHDLGGPGLPYNLFPISNAANQEHSQKVEQKVKGLLYGTTAKRDAFNNLATDTKVYYEVEVKNQKDDLLTADFACKWYVSDPQGNNKTLEGTETISSDLKNSSGYAPSKHSQPVPASWSKGKKQSTKGSPNGIDFESPFTEPSTAGGATYVGVKEGTEFKEKPAWVDELLRFDIYADQAKEVVDAWVKSQKKSYEVDDINNALNIAIKGVPTVVHPKRGAADRQRKHGANGKGTVAGTKFEPITATFGTHTERMDDKLAKIKRDRDFKKGLVQACEDMLAEAEDQLEDPT
ncbi:DUF4157 domain-containing protein [Undibacterium sp. Di26W]|uniref:eCIS core domain-containing protein n=1 Tax=Undibacterium sp. Di26W TaxID=3413035 RepID=UPI003BF3E2AE